MWEFSHVVLAGRTISNNIYALMQWLRWIVSYTSVQIYEIEDGRMGKRCEKKVLNVFFEPLKVVNTHTTEKSLIRFSYKKSFQWTTFPSLFSVKSWTVTKCWITKELQLQLQLGGRLQISLPLQSRNFKTGARICKRLLSPGIDSEELIPLAFQAEDIYNMKILGYVGFVKA